MLIRNEIEEKSMKIIDDLVGNPNINIEEKEIRSRIVHATGDIDLYWKIIISPGAIDAAVRAIYKKSNIITDVKMVEAGIRKKWLREKGIKLFCFIDKKEILREAKLSGKTRAATAIRHIKDLIPNSIILIGNAPTALFEILEIIREENDIKKLPSFIAGLPVGFVGAKESKEKLTSQNLVPHITLPGTRGGSNLAAAVMNAIINIFINRQAQRN